MSWTYDHWKTTNPADEWLGPDPEEKDEEPVIDWWEPEPSDKPREPREPTKPSG